MSAPKFHPTPSCSNLRVPVPDIQDCRVVLSSDDRRVVGHGRCETGTTYYIQRVPVYNCDQSVEIYLPSRSAQVLGPL